MKFQDRLDEMERDQLEKIEWQDRLEEMEWQDLLEEMEWQDWLDEMEWQDWLEEMDNCTQKYLTLCRLAARLSNEQLLRWGLRYSLMNK